MKKYLSLIVAMLLLLFWVNAWALDDPDSGIYSIDNVKNGGAWAGSDVPELVIGHTYSPTTMYASYDYFDLDLGPDFTETVTGKIEIGGVEVFKVTDSYDEIKYDPPIGNDNVWWATWVLTGELVVPVSVGPGVKVATLSLWDENERKRLTKTFTKVKLKSAVPEPATLLLLGAGLAGIFGLRRKHHLKKS